MTQPQSLDRPSLSTLLLFDPEAVQETNNAACTSKASAEQTGWIDAAYFQVHNSHVPPPHYTHYFCPTVKRRASLINRGYAVRMCLIRETIKRLTTMYTGSLQVLSLGAGFDTNYLHFQGLVKRWVEVDLPAVIAAKQSIISKHPEVLFKPAELYHVLVALDLRQLDHELSTLKELMLPGVPTLVLCECVLAYLPPELSSWLPGKLAQSFEHVLAYEQLLLDKAHDPFSRRMAEHFQEQGSSLMSPLTSLAEARKRFYPCLPRGFSVMNLEEAIYQLLPPEMALFLDKAVNDLPEAFDEWEEWACKKAHYAIVLTGQGLPTRTQHTLSSTTSLVEWSTPALKCPITPSMLEERWSAAVTRVNDHSVALFGGFRRHRLKELYLIDTNDSGNVTFIDSGGSVKTPCPRIHHSLNTWVNSEGKRTFLVLFGGRNKCPSALPLQDLWLFDMETRSWHMQSDSIPVLSARHQAVIHLDWLIILAPGQFLVHDLARNVTQSRHLLNWHLYELFVGTLPNRRSLHRSFSASMWRFSVYVYSDAMSSHLLKIDLQEMSCSLLEMANFSHQKVPRRSFLPKIQFHQMLSVDTVTWHGLFLIGGIDVEHDGKFTDYVLYIDLVHGYFLKMQGEMVGALGNLGLIKHAACTIATHDNILNPTLVIKIFGGGQVVFSMGHYHCPPMTTIQLPENLLPKQVDLLLYNNVPNENEPYVTRKFAKLFSSWSLEYVKAAIPGDTLVSIHKSTAPRLSFHPRNFEFEVLQWANMWSMLLHKPTLALQYIYLRSIGSNPRKRPACINESFPGLEIDPSCLLPDNTRYEVHSSVLRIASPGLSLWTHYDVLDNVLVQIIGWKVVTLWHPLDIRYLKIHGSSTQLSSSDDGPPVIPGAKPRNVLLGPGDALHIPAFWFHHVHALSAPPFSEPSIAINVFYKEKCRDFYQQKDLYGNADLVPFVECQRKLQEMRVKLNEDKKVASDKFPDYYAAFYEHKLFYETE